MAQTFSLETLAEVAAEVIGVPTVRLTPRMSANEVPGWDSLNHTLIILEISNMLGIELRADEIATLPDLGSVVDFVNERLS
jgi:acyl carrier protein